MNPHPPTTHWLLLRGLGRLRQHWHDFPDHLHRAGVALHVDAIDLPGVGDAHRETCPLNIPAITERVRQRFAKTRAHTGDQRWGVIALSLGGMVALDWCERHPDDFARCVVINTSSAADAHPLRRLRPAMLAALPRLLANRAPRKRERVILELTTARPDHAADRFLDDRAALAAEHGTPTIAILRQLFAAARYQGPARAPVPTLVLAAAADRLCDPLCSRRLAIRLCTEFREHPWGGHDLPIDDSPWLAQQIAERLAPA